LVVKELHKSIVGRYRQYGRSMGYIKCTCRHRPVDVAEVLPLGLLHFALLNGQMSSQLQGHPHHGSNMTSRITNVPCKAYMATSGSLREMNPAARP